MKKLSEYSIIFILIIFSFAICYADQTITAIKISTPIVVDGKADDPQWGKSQAIEVTDQIASITVTLKSLYTDKQIFFLVTFPDKDESRTHKTWEWSRKKHRYVMGADREDTFIFKWSMEDNPVDLSIYADNPYFADVWFWKACRTDPVGYADNKSHKLSRTEFKKNKKIIGRSGQIMYLKRIGDEGKSAYKTTLFLEYEKDKMPYFKNRIPTLNRANIKAKGEWSNGKWIIEFSRNLIVESKYDIQFNPKRRYQFGISRYEIAGRQISNINNAESLYGAGDTGEPLYLTFKLE